MGQNDQGKRDNAVTIWLKRHKKATVIGGLIVIGITLIVALIIGLVLIFGAASDDDGCDNPSSDTTTSSTIQNSADKTKNAKTIWEFLHKKGATDTGAAAIMGVWDFESGLSPTAANPSGATGIAQWLGDRYTKLKALADKEGKSTTDLGLQLDYFWQEAQDPYYHKAVVAAFKASGDLHAAVKAFLMDYEGMSQNPEQWYLESNGAGGPGRYQMADSWYAQLTKSDPVASGVLEDTATSSTATEDGGNTDSSDSSCSTSSSDDGSTIGGKWGWPFKGMGTFGDEQTFGASASRQGNFHDGLDFGSVNWPGNDIMAVHAGKVIFAGNPGIAELGNAIVVIKDGDMSFVYQEFTDTGSALEVKVGDSVETGQVIAHRDTNHLHLGITKSEWRAAEAHAFTNDGTWLNPQKLITEGLNGGS